MLDGLLRKFLGGLSVLGVEEEGDEVVQGKLSTSWWHQWRTAARKVGSWVIEEDNRPVRELRNLMVLLGEEV